MHANHCSHVLTFSGMPLQKTGQCYNSKKEQTCPTNACCFEIY